MRISGTKPSSVILSQTCNIKKLKINGQKVPKQAEAKRDGLQNQVSELKVKVDTCSNLSFL